MLKIIFPVLLIAIYRLIFATQVFAQGEFETDYKVVYQVNENGQSTVIQDITLKNKTTNYYADKFELKIGSARVENVKATDAQGPLETSVKFEDNVTTIDVKFNQRVIGLEKTLPWTLSYTSAELVQRAGQIWEISIPRLSKSQEIASYQATIKVPTSFGPIAYSVPSPQTAAKSPKLQEFTFSKDQLIQSGIAISFGEKQVFTFRLSYYLENKNLTTQTIPISLPPDNNYQRVVLEKLEPKPENILVDGDNNYLARYKLSPKTKIDVVASGYVEVFSRPSRKITAQLSDRERNFYTQPQKYWETDNAFIRDKAHELKNPREIYDFVTSFLIYSKERLSQQKIERMGAASALNSPEKAVCMEFTDLFITIARAAGIPTREVEGFAYTQNERLRPLSLTLPQGDILHAWPEYWDDNLGWVQIDPTWGSTSGGLDYFDKLDFNHITFVQRGLSSTEPYPAGSFKREENLGEKTVFVEFAKELPTPVMTVQLTLSTPQKLIGGIPIRLIAQVANSGTTAIINKNLTLTSNLLIEKSPFSQEVTILPPMSSRQFEFKLQSRGIFKRFEDSLILSFADSQIAKPVEIVPIYMVFLVPEIILSLAVALIIIAVGFWLYKKITSKKLQIQEKLR